MIYLRIISVIIALLGLSNQSHAYYGPPTSSVSSGEIIILPPPDDQQEEQWRGVSGNAFKSGKWLALVCDADKCRLVSVMLKVTNNPLPKGEMPEFFIAQTMKWDLSAIRKDENIVMLVMPHAGLEPGAVQTWYIYDPTDPDRPGNESVETGKETVVTTASADKPDRTSIIMPMEVTNESCAEAQASNDECPRKTFRVQLLEGKARQWMGAPLTAPCYQMVGIDGIPNNYLRWVGDLDHDQKPDYVINLGGRNGYFLMLSSLAKPGQLVGEAGRYKPWIACD